MPRVTGPQVVRALQRAGWERAEQEGSHLQLRHPNRPGRVTVSMHRGAIVPLKTLGRILQQAGLTSAELKELL